jgi:hypothetical protein
MNRLTILVAGCVFGVVVAGTAFAQFPTVNTPDSSALQAPAKPGTGGGSAQKPATTAGKKTDKPNLSIRGIVSFGMTTLTSAQSFDAVAGKHAKTTFGVGAEVQNIWKGVFAGLTYSPLSLDGERVFVDGGTVYPLGIPVTIGVNYLDVVGGWRFLLKSTKAAPPKPGQKPPAKDPLPQVTGQPPPQKPPQPATKPPQTKANSPRVVPFVGGGLTAATYKETSANSNGDDVSEGATGFVVLGGVDVTLTRWVHVGGEFRYRAVNGVLGSGGVSQLYGEESLGGYAFGVRVTVGR